MVKTSLTKLSRPSGADDSRRPTIHLALTDDWELRGNGSGDVAEIQFRPMAELLRIFQNYEVKATFNVEVMQQLMFRKLQAKHQELGPLADGWDEHVREAFKHGHDIQLHIHPQWSAAEYNDGKWTLSGDWSLTKYDANAARSMLEKSKDYIENLLRPIDSSYRCVSFRSGSSSIAPSGHALGLLASLGIVFDMSIVGGMRVNTRNLQIDYTSCEESFLPFYPRMEDARKVSDKKEPIVCIPIFHFYLSRRRATARVLSKAWQKTAQTISPGTEPHIAADDYSNQEWSEIGRSSRWARLYDKAIGPCLKGKHMVADLSQLDYASLHEMLAAIRRMARASGLRELPVILTNHSKYIKDSSHIERFISDAATADDIRFTTLTELANKLQAGDFPIKRAAADNR